jgi:hypothetical protein
LSRVRLAVSAIALAAATVPASAVLAVPALADAGSPRVPTSITGFTATADPQGTLTVRVEVAGTDRIEHPTITRSGSYVTARGQLQHYYNGWKPSAGQQVKIVLEPKGGTKWYWIAQPRTNAAGWFTATVRATVSAHWAASYPGDSTHFAAGSPQSWISG